MTRVLGTLQHELAALAGMSDEVQETLSDLLGAMQLSNADLVAIQNLDLIAQHLAALATYVERLSEQVPPDWTVFPERAASEVKLSALAHRLSFHSPSEAAEDPDDPLLF
ncbi:hypothetical protein [Enterovirga aerilata]|uniref:Uncharacterized protein n=1 Tax=Enterovirga aerilata TaxID=2730920 RepID=A0A849I0U7_9HYPH|nr:hypothetical protein [Enterovirga sp. DB1703]NNM71194.1 hypothetical protein [Enterovirga sp. DB1703]